MHLNRQRGSHIEQFKQQWKPVQSARRLPQQQPRPAIEYLSERLPFELPVGDDAGVIISVAQQPRLPDRPIGERCGEELGKTSAAPEPILIGRLESQRIQSHWIHATRGSNLGLYDSRQTTAEQQCHCRAVYEETVAKVRL